MRPPERPAGEAPSGRRRVIPIVVAAPVARDPVAEAARELQICNACRYCEGFCAVFPAMARRLEFPPADIHYLANLCHHCGACLHACQYAPPHEFALDLPRALARVRVRTYAAHAWPAVFGRLYERAGLALGLALAVALALLLAMVLGAHGRLWQAVAGGNFYAILPHALLVGLFAPVFAFSLLALGVGVTRFWRGAPAGPPSAGALGEALGDALRLKYLDGGHGDGCPNDDDHFTLARRRWHHLSFYGFMLCFAATVAGTVWHYALGRVAPYDWLSLPKLLGTAGGLGLLIGPLGQWRLHRRRDPEMADPAQQPLDLGFIALLWLAGASGLALALARGTAALPLLLCLHLGTVLAFFALMPYGKFAHGLYRVAALLKWAIERRRPARLRLASE